MITPTVVDSEEKAMSLLSVRNSCRTFMTNHQDEITEEEQKVWYNESVKDNPDIVAYLFWEGDGTFVVPVGYGLIRVSYGVATLTGGLVDNRRGAGHGKMLFQYLIYCANDLGCDIAALEVLKTNHRAISLYKTLGFKEVSDDYKIRVMVKAL